MKLHLNQDDARYQIRGYQPGQVTVNNEVLTRSFVVTATDLIRDWPPQSFQELQAAHFELVVWLRPEVVILGSGARQQFPTAVSLRPIVDAGIGVEVMDTGAACRTFNVLVAEGRRVAAALLL
jgi:uncharacterized protein